MPPASRLFLDVAARNLIQQGLIAATTSAQKALLAQNSACQ
jgi:hypothetical protein